jgi:hypothetical protein
MPPRTPSTGSLLESLVRALHYVPDQAPGIRCAGDLPARLRDRTHMCGRGTWKAWGDETYVWFVTAERIRKSEEPAILAKFFDMDGRCMAEGVWRRRGSVGWVLDAPCG